MLKKRVKSTLRTLGDIFLGMIIAALLLALVTKETQASTLNPCEYMNINAEKMNQLDTGDDENFRRIVQQKNREMIIACQDYQIKQLQQRTADWNRDNY